VSSAAGSVGAGRPRGERRTITLPVPRIGTPAAVGTGVAATLVLAAFVATGGLRLEPTTRVLIALMLAGAGLVAVAVVRTPRRLAGPLYGGSSVLAFAVLGVFTALSIVWSLAPADSWMEANRTFAYLAAFAGTVALVRMAPSAWTGVLGGLAVAAVAICGWALLTKVFPGSLAGDETYARLRAPFEYWNSVGLMAGLGVPPLLWLAARRTGHAAVNALAWPGLAVLFTCVMLSYSRGAVVALALGVGFWFSVVPLRLAGLMSLLAAAVASAALTAWAFSQDGLTTDRAPIEARVDAGHEFGALLVLVVAVLLIAGLAAQFVRAQRPPTPRARRIAGRSALGVLALLVVVAVAAVAAAPGGIDGQTRKAWTQLTDASARTPANTPDRLTATSSVRARYWDEAFKVHAASPWIGTGAGGYVVARTRYRRDTLEVRHAHGYVPQTLADLGWAGLLLSAAALVAWALCAAASTGLRRRDRGLPFGPERIGLLTLTAVVVVFGVHSALDWTWFVPANAIAGVVAAGWVAGRGPLRRAAPARGARRAGRLRERFVEAVRAEPLRAGAATLVVLIGLVAAWTAFQPVRSVHASDAAFERMDLGAKEAAASIAVIATERNPLSVDAQFDLAAIEQSRPRLGAAEDALQRAVALEPANAETWRRLGRFRLDVLKQPRDAVDAFQAAYYLDPASPVSVSDLLEASRAAEGP
jgi:hypothetical protein